MDLSFSPRPPNPHDGWKWLISDRVKSHFVVSNNNRTIHCKRERTRNERAMSIPIIGTRGFFRGHHTWTVTVDKLSGYAYIGVCHGSIRMDSSLYCAENRSKVWVMCSDGKFQHNNKDKKGFTLSAGDVVTVDLDMDEQMLSFSKNGGPLRVAFTEVTGEVNAIVGVQRAGDKLSLEVRYDSSPPRQCGDLEFADDCSDTESVASGSSSASFMSGGSSAFSLSSAASAASSASTVSARSSLSYRSYGSRTSSRSHRSVAPPSPPGPDLREQRLLRELEEAMAHNTATTTTSSSNTNTNNNNNTNKTTATSHTTRAEPTANSVTTTSSHGRSNGRRHIEGGADRGFPKGEGPMLADNGGTFSKRESLVLTDDGSFSKRESPMLNDDGTSRVAPMLNNCVHSSQSGWCFTLSNPKITCSNKGFSVNAPTAALRGALGAMGSTLFTQGKQTWSIRVDGCASYCYVGVALPTVNLKGSLYHESNRTSVWLWCSDGHFEHGGSSTPAPQYTIGDTVDLCWDADAATLTVQKNGGNRVCAFTGVGGPVRPVVGLKEGTNLTLLKTDLAGVLVIPSNSLTPTVTPPPSPQPLSLSQRLGKTFRSVFWGKKAASPPRTPTPPQAVITTNESHSRPNTPPEHPKQNPRSRSSSLTPPVTPTPTTLTTSTTPSPTNAATATSSASGGRRTPSPKSSSSASSSLSSSPRAKRLSPRQLIA